MTIPSRPISEIFTHPEPELVFGIVSPVGCNVEMFQGAFEGTIRQYKYETNIIGLSSLIEKVHTEHVDVIVKTDNQFQRIDSYMTAGNRLRELSGRGDLMALHAVAQIRQGRPMDKDKRRTPIPRKVHLLRSLKHPKEVEALRRVYGPGFFLIGLHATEEQRRAYLMGPYGMTREQADRLMERDKHEDEELGQQTRDTFTLSDVFVLSGHEHDQLARFLDMVFGDPHRTPTRDEHAMFLAYGASLRSGQLARQVGAVVVSAEGEVISSGANDVPCFGGGQYFAEDAARPDRRDHKEGFDANDREISRIITEIIERVKTASTTVDEAKLRELLQASPIGDLTEYGRPVHAEMEALLACARTGVSAKGGTLYTTTFPCHNCAKHIVAAGIVKVVYVEPYPKSKARDLHPDSIALDDMDAKDRVVFAPFVGIAARRYFDLFSMRLGDGIEIKRKNKEDGSAVAWKRVGAKPRIRMAMYSYLERETLVTVELGNAIENLQKKATAAVMPTPTVPPAGAGCAARKVDHLRA